jgi:hypothetical protein
MTLVNEDFNAFVRFETFFIASVTCLSILRSKREGVECT